MGKHLLEVTCKYDRQWGSYKTVKAFHNMKYNTTVFVGNNKQRFSLRNVCCQPSTNTKYGCVCDSQFLLLTSWVLVNIPSPQIIMPSMTALELGMFGNKGHRLETQKKWSICYYWWEIVCLVCLYRDLFPTTGVELFLYVYRTKEHRLGIRWKWFICYCWWQSICLLWLYRSWGHR